MKASHFLWRGIYNLVLVPLTFVIFGLGFLVDKKTRKGWKGRMGLWKRLRENLGRFEGQPKIWFHVSSMGELLQAQPVIRILKKSHPEICVVLTVFSPTGYEWAKKDPGVDLFEYLPSDGHFAIRKLYRWIQPTAVVLVKFDLWPNLIWMAQKHNVPIFLISATMNPQSLRVRFALTRSFYGTLYSGFDQIFVVSKNDQKLILQSTPELDHVSVVGDTRADSVLDRKRREEETALNPILTWIQKMKRPTLVVGSSWPRDEALILPAWKRVKAEIPEALLVLVPHEPTLNRIEGLGEALDRMDQRWERYSKLSGSRMQDSFDAIIVDRVGLLAGLYRIGQVAYVGSGTGGVHNTMEPAAWGCPIIFGPRYHNAPEAFEFLRREGAVTVSTSEQMVTALRNWLNDPEKSLGCGEQNRLFLSESTGAAKTCAARILEVFERGKV